MSNIGGPAAAAGAGAKERRVLFFVVGHRYMYTAMISYPVNTANRAGKEHVGGFTNTWDMEARTAVVVVIVVVVAAAVVVLKIGCDHDGC